MLVTGCLFPAVLPGSHVLGLDQGEGWSDFETTQPIVQELKLVAPEGKGQAVLIHYDLVHRGTARLVDRDGALWRPMHKVCDFSSPLLASLLRAHFR